LVILTPEDKETFLSVLLPPERTTIFIVFHLILFIYLSAILEPTEYHSIGKKTISEFKF